MSVDFGVLGPINHDGYYPTLAVDIVQAVTPDAGGEASITFEPHMLESFHIQVLLPSYDYPSRGFYVFEITSDNTATGEPYNYVSIQSFSQLSGDDLDLYNSQRDLILDYYPDPAPDTLYGPEFTVFDSTSLTDITNITVFVSVFEFRDLEGGGVYIHQLDTEPFNVRLQQGSAGPPTVPFVDRSLSPGDDDVTLGNGNDRIFAGAGNDRVWGGNGTNWLEGQSGNDDLIGGNGRDIIYGGDGHDILEGGAGSDHHDGGPGSDRISYANATGPIAVNLSTGSGTEGDANGDTYESVENLTGSSYDDFIIGDDAANSIIGGDGHDEIRGGGGTDKLYGGNGHDILVGGLEPVYFSGGSGFDIVDYWEPAWLLGDGQGILVNLANSASNLGIALGDTYSSIEGVAGTDYDDVVYANSGDNQLAGYAGNDTLHGGAGSDLLMGDAGNDKLYGQDGSDQFYGGSGKDALSGGDGNDTMYGGLGADYLSGGAGSDRASYLSSSSGLKVNLGTASQNTGEAKGDTYNSIENLTGSNFNDSLLGSAGANRISGANGNDTINGLAGNDVIFGGSGNDRIYGHLGSDTLEGNAGSDTFIFHTALGATNIDTIADFNRAADTIELWNDVFTALGTGALAASAFKDMAVSAKDASDRIIYNSDTGILYYDADGSGTAYGNVKFAVLTGKPDITASDFVVL